MSPLDANDLDKIEERMRRHDSAEQPITLNEKARVSWPVLLTLLVAFGAASVAIAQGQSTTAKVEKLETAKETAAAEVQSLKVQAAESKAENKAEHKAMVDLLQQIRDDVKELRAEIKSKK